MYQQVVQRIQQQAVETAAGTSAASAAIAWLPAITEIFQLLAAVIAVASGVMAFVWHRRKARLLDAQLQQLRAERHFEHQGRYDGTNAPPTERQFSLGSSEHDREPPRS